MLKSSLDHILEDFCFHKIYFNTWKIENVRRNTSFTNPYNVNGNPYICLNFIIRRFLWRHEFKMKQRVTNKITKKKLFLYRKVRFFFYLPVWFLTNLHSNFFHLNSEKSISFQHRQTFIVHLELLTILWSFSPVFPVCSFRY